jgi:EamA-like transporter family protein
MLAVSSPRPTRGEALGLLVVGNALWAGTYVAGKIALTSLSFVQLYALRFSIAALLLGPVLWSGRAVLRRELAQPASRRALARLVLLGFVLNKGFEYAGLSLSTAVDVALLIATESMFTAMLSWIVLREPVRASPRCSSLSRRSRQLGSVGTRCSHLNNNWRAARRRRRGCGDGVQPPADPMREVDVWAVVH